VSSSYATAREGDAAYAALLVRNGHAIVRSRRAPSTETFRAGDTVVLLDPPFVERKDAAALRSFVQAGGHLVVASGGGRWLGQIVGQPPAWEAPGLAVAPAVAPVPGVGHVATAAQGSWTDAHGALPLLGNSERSVAALAEVGSGRVLLLADSSLLQNAYLDRADNAAFGLAAAGERGRRVVFLETYHGYGRSTGLAAIPTRWSTALLVAAFGVFVFMLSRVRRFGPPEPDARELPPPRAQYVESLAATLTRARDRSAALEPLRAEVRRRVLARSGLRADADDAMVGAAASRLGFSADEIAALLGARDELALGRAQARTADWRSSTWMN
jgi:hypothetical protein